MAKNLLGKRTALTTLSRLGAFVAISILSLRFDDRVAADALTFDVLAKTGDPVAVAGGSGSLAFIDSTISLNKFGQVAFTGTATSGSSSYTSVFAADDTGPRNLATSLNNTSRIFSFPWINDSGEIVARDAISAMFFVRKYSFNDPGPATGPMFTVAKTGDPTPLGGAYSSVTLPSIDNSGKVAFLGIVGSTSYMFIDPGINGASEAYMHTFAAGGGFRPAIADGEQVVVRNGGSSTSPIVLSHTGSLLKTIASSPDFSALGSSPGISDDGKVIAFYGVLTPSGATSLNAAQSGASVPTLVPGEGIFASIATGSQRIVERIAGLTNLGSGELGPGDFWVESNANGTLQQSEIHGFTSFTADSRISINKSSMGNANANYRFAFLAKNYVEPEKTGVFTGHINGGTRGLISPAQPLVLSGQLVDGLAPTSFALYDSVNTSDQVAFWGSTSGGQNLVARASRKVDPLRQFEYPWATERYAASEYDTYVAGLPASDPNKASLIAAANNYNLRARGCAITSYAMALRQLGLSDITPIELHSQLEASGGISRIDPVKGFISFKNGVPSFNGASVKHEKLEAMFNGLRSKEIFSISGVVTALSSGDPVVLNVKGGHHWVLATGLSEDGKIEIIDPGSNLKDRGYTVAELDAWNFEKGRHLYVDETAMGVIQTQSPIEFMVTSPSGLRLGTNPISGQTFAEIPNSSYAPEYPILAPDDELTPSEEADIAPYLPHIAFINSLESGQYQVDVYGTATGDFAFDFTYSNPAGGFSTFHATGDVITGQTISYTINVGASPTPGDLNSDGHVDAADYVFWRKNLSSDPAKYTEWRANFGQPSGSGAGASAVTAVPEPASVLLLAAMVAVAGSGFARRRAWRRAF